MRPRDELKSVLSLFRPVLLAGKPRLPDTAVKQRDFQWCSGDQAPTRLATLPLEVETLSKQSFPLGLSLPLPNFSSQVKPGRSIPEI